MDGPSDGDVFDAATLPPSGSTHETATIPPPNMEDAPTLPPRGGVDDTAKDDDPSPTPHGARGAGSAVVSGYEILGELGRGGMGVVYKARQVGLGRTVALKMILSGAHAGADDLDRFRGEAEAIARLQHPGIVQVHDIGEKDGLPFFSLEFVEGGSLADRLDGTPWPPRKAAALVETIAGAVHEAHKAGIVHRDLKPANVLMTKDDQPKITDFGLAKRLDADLGRTASGAIMGTPSFMAPEQAGGKTGQIGPAADTYALGAILYDLLTGRPPFKAATPLDTVMLVATEEPVPPSRLVPKLPRDLETIVLKCLEKDPSRRYESARAMADDLHRFLSGEPIAARPVGRAERSWRWCARNPRLAAAIGAIAASLLLVAIVSAVSARMLSNRAKELRQALNDARTQKGIAEQQKTIADGRTKQAEAEKHRAERLLATSTYDRGLRSARRGKSIAGCCGWPGAWARCPPARGTWTGPSGRAWGRGRAARSPWNGSCPWPREGVTRSGSPRKARGSARPTGRKSAPGRPREIRSGRRFRCRLERRRSSSRPTAGPRSSSRSGPTSRR